MKLLKDIINNNRILCNLNPEDIDDFPIGGGGGGGGAGGGGIFVPPVVPAGISVSPLEDQYVIKGANVCFTASGNLSLPQEPAHIPVFDPGCNSWSQSTGVFQKTCGANGTYDADAIVSRTIYQRQPFYIIGKNNTFSYGTPTPYNNVSMRIGVKSSAGYTYVWEVYAYCNSSGACSPQWYAYIKIINPQGVVSTPKGGFVEQAQSFKVSSNGNSIIFEHTTEGNWAYNYYITPIPEDSGDWNLYMNALFLNNKWENVRAYRGSYQGAVGQFNWTSDCPNTLTTSGSRNEVACIVPTENGTCQVCVSAPGLDPVCRNITTSDLFFEMIDGTCGGCES